MRFLIFSTAQFTNRNHTESIFPTSCSRQPITTRECSKDESSGRSFRIWKWKWESFRYLSWIFRYIFEIIYNSVIFYRCLFFIHVTIWIMFWGESIQNLRISLNIICISKLCKSFHQNFLILWTILDSIFQHNPILCFKSIKIDAHNQFIFHNLFDIPIKIIFKFTANCS